MKRLDSTTNLFHWEIKMLMSEKGPWEGAEIKIRMYFDETYPNTPPTVQFVQAPFHPNIYESGTPCLGMLHENYWKPRYCISTIIHELRYLLNHPNVDDAVNPTALKFWKTNQKKYWIENKKRFFNI